MSNQRYREEHREELREKARRYYSEHKEEMHAKDKARYQRERQTRLRRAKEYAEHNRDKVKEYQKEYRKKNREKLNKYSSEMRSKRKQKYGEAHHFVSHALANSKIEKKPCDVCGAEDAEAHHDDYNKPLEVRWLCRACHAEWHKNNKPIYKEGENA